ncbi:MAG TPA: STAS domain-containing protein [Pseudonocardiaceae bacterium]|jgi:anti-anti-sigma factor|nr:STAS domain-containing protein [Pseudonocardiaceae bacterium]
MIGAVEAGDVESFEMSEVDADGAVVLRIAGEVDLLTSGAVGRRCAAILKERPAAFVLDLTGVTFLGAIGMSELVEAHDQSVTVGTVFAVVVSSRCVLHTLTIVGLDELLTLRATVADALCPGVAGGSSPTTCRPFASLPSQRA